MFCAFGTAKLLEGAWKYPPVVRIHGSPGLLISD